MKRATAKFHACRPLTLIARRAAGAFRRRRLRSTLSHRETIWAPVLLRWACRRQGVPASVSPRASAPTGTWISHFHFHFRLFRRFCVALASGHARVVESAAGTSLRFFSSNGVPVARSLRDTMRDARGQDAVEARNVPARVAWHVAGAGSAAMMRYATRVDRVGHFFSAVHQPPGWPDQEWPDPARIAQARSEALSPGRLGSRVDLRPSGLADSHPFARQHLWCFGAAQSTRLFARARDTLSSRSQSSVGRSFRRAKLEGMPVSTRARSAEATAPHVSPRLRAFAIEPSVDLVWRSITSEAAAAGSAPRSAMTSASSAPSARSTPAAAPSSPGRNVDATVVCASALDPVLADRLADDVIRRIDRRARIERERRGA